MSKPNKFFSKLNYTLANEDTEFECRLTSKSNPKRILSVCGSGSRCFPLIAEQTEELICVDLSIEQIYLAKLREQTHKEFSYEDFCLFWGYPPFSAKDFTDKRQSLFESVKLENEVSNYFKNVFTELKWESVLYIGKWEKTFSLFSKIVSKVMGKNVRTKMFSFDDLDEQRKYMMNEFPTFRWKLLVAIIGNKSMFNALLYKGDFIQKNVEDSYLQYYSKAFNNLFYNGLIKNSFFLQLCFYGEIVWDSGNLIEAKEENFLEIKERLKGCKVTYENCDLIEAIKKYEDLDYISLSDVPSYFSGEIETNFYQEIKPSLSAEALVVNRNYLRIPKSNKTDYKDITDSFEKEIQEEKVQMYRIEVLTNE